MASIDSAVQRPVWHDTATHESVRRDFPARTAPRDARFDIVVVGGGLSGLWTAYYASRQNPSARIAVVEARTVGFGASGRNGGWCSGFFPLMPSELADLFGRERAMHAYAESFATLDEIERVVRTEGIACDWHRGGTIQSASTPLQAGRLRKMLADQHATGLGESDMSWIEADRVANHLRLAETHGAIRSPHCATVNPYALVVGLARVVRAHGVELFENSRVVSIDDGTVVHEHGVMRGELVVQATEAYSNSFRSLRRRLVPLYSLMVATEPLDATALSAIGWRDRATFNDGSEMIIYAQLTRDGRIAFGGRGAPYHFASRVRDRFDIDDATHRHIVAAIARHFPAARDARITHRWGGPLGVPRDWTPSVTVQRARRHARIGGYVGDGVAATNLFARTVLDVWHRRNTSLAALPFVGHESPRWEPEPVRFVAINSLLRLSERIDRRELRRGKRPRVLAKIFESLI